MSQDNDDKEFWERLEQKIHLYSNAQLEEMLRTRSSYRKRAVELAVAEAIRRGLIKNEAELEEEKFREISARFSLFPRPVNSTLRTKIIRSLSRSLLIAGAIPTVFGVYRILHYAPFEGGALTLIGLIWISSAWIIYTRYNSRFWSPMLIIALLGAIYIGRTMLLLKGLTLIDYLIAGGLNVVIFYSLFYLRILLKDETENP